MNVATSNGCGGGGAGAFFERPVFLTDNTFSCCGGQRASSGRSSVLGDYTGAGGG